MTELIFNGECFPRLVVTQRVRAPCKDCHGLGYLEDEDQEVIECLTCSSTGTMELPVPNSNIRVSSSQKHKNADVRTRAAFYAYQKTLKKSGYWRDAVIAVIAVADKMRK